MSFKYQNMLVRAYPPFFSSLFGIYASQIYKDLLVIYHDNWCYWYVPLEIYNNIDKKEINAINNNNNNNELLSNFYNESINTYLSSYNRILEIIESTNIREKNHLLSYYNEDLLMNEHNHQIPSLWDYYGLIIGSPQMIISEQSYTEIYNLLGKILNSTIKNESSKQIIYSNYLSKLLYENREAESTLIHFERDLLINAQNINKQFYTHINKNINESIPTPNGDSFSIENRYKKAFHRRLANIDEFFNPEQLLKELIDDHIKRNMNVFKNNYNPIRSGWEFGKYFSHEELFNRLFDILKFDTYSEILSSSNIFRIDYMLLFFDNKFKYYEDNKRLALKKLKSLDPSSNSLNSLINMCKKISGDGWLRFNRKILASMINYHIYKDINRIYKKLDIGEFHNIYFILLNEMCEGDNRKKPNINEIKSRRKWHLSHYKKGKLEYQESDLDEIRSYLSNFEIIGDNPTIISKSTMKVIKGDAMHFDDEEFIEGNAVKIDNYQDLINISNNDIVVSRMLEPHFGIVCKRPKAIVIEDPGKTSHAVYVARSKGIPIIVNAKGILEYIRKEHIIDDNIIKNDFGLKLHNNGEIQKTTL